MNTFNWKNLIFQKDSYKTNNLYLILLDFFKEKQIAEVIRTTLFPKKLYAI